MTRKKLTRVQLKSLREIHHFGGALITSFWTNGSGRYVTTRTIPPFCERIERSSSGNYPKRIQKVFNAHPRCKAVIAITNMRSANKELKRLEELERKEKEAETKALTAKAAKQYANSDALNLPDGASDKKIMQLWHARGAIHPAPVQVLEIKRKSGLSWKKIAQGLGK